MRDNRHEDGGEGGLAGHETSNLPGPRTPDGGDAHQASRVSHSTVSSSVVGATLNEVAHFKRRPRFRVRGQACGDSSKCRFEGGTGPSHHTGVDDHAPDGCKLMDVNRAVERRGVNWRCELAV